MPVAKETPFSLAIVVVGGRLLQVTQTGNFAIAGATLSIPGIITAIFGAIVFIFIWGLVVEAD